MAVNRVSITRAQWRFSAQGIPGAARVDTINGAAAQRCVLLNIPPCVAIAISPKSEVRAITVGPPGAAWPAAMFDLVEGAPQMFSWPGGLVDLVKLDWTDGYLEIECAETPEDVANLSVFVSPNASVVVDALASPAIIHVQPPRAMASAWGASGGAIRVGGAGAPFTVLGSPLAPSGLSIAAGLTASAGTNTMAVVSTTIGLGSAPVAVSFVPGTGRNAVAIFQYTDAGALLSAVCSVRAV